MRQTVLRKSKPSKNDTPDASNKYYGRIVIDDKGNNRRVLDVVSVPDGWSIPDIEDSLYYENRTLKPAYRAIPIWQPKKYKA